MVTQGDELINRCKVHVLATPRTLPKRALTAPGLRNKGIELVATAPILCCGPLLGV